MILRPQTQKFKIDTAQVYLNMGYNEKQNQTVISPHRQ
jgi:hypothetical protein